MALTPTEEALVRQLLDQQAAILSLAGNEATITSKLGATKVTLSDLLAASSVGDTDLFLTRQGTTDKSVTAALLKSQLQSFQQTGDDAVIRSIVNKLTDIVSVKDFGAVGDGIADDTAKIQAALNSGASAVDLVDGNYKITSTLFLNSGQIFIGRGGQITTSDGLYFPAITVLNKSDCSVFRIKIVGPSGGNGFDQGVLVTGSSNVTIQECLIKDIGLEASVSESGHGIEIGGNSSNIKVLFNTIENIKGYGDLRGDGITVRASTGTLIEGNKIGVVRRMQIAIIDDAKDVRILGNQLENGYLDGIDIEPNSVNATGEIIIHGNTIRNFGSKPGATIGAQFHGIDLHSNEFDNISIVGNVITAENAQAISCIHGQNLAKFATISGNVLWCNGYADGMTLFSGNGFKNLIIAGNVIREFSSYGISGDKNGNVVVNGNIIDSSQASAANGIRLVAGSTNPSLPVIVGNHVAMTGTSIAAGIFLQAAQAFTISDNIVSVASGNGLEVYSNIAGMIGASITGNQMIDTGSGVNAYYLRSAGAGAVVNCMFANNSQAGFATPIALSGSITFSKDVLETYLGSALPGNNNITLTARSSAKTVIYDTPITVARTVTLSTTNAQAGDSFRIVRTANCTGAFAINIGTGPLKALSAASQWAEVTYNGTAWVLTAYGAL